MITKRIIKRAFGGNICRRCINQLAGARLERKDCIYDSYPSECPSCGVPQNIVTGFRLSGRIKLIGKKTDGK